ncbi:hypothetical protein NDI76_16205 [Halogeometricum sp. S1BR25-6]|uniref:GH16 domain-containing protein n=1 Tax=Halogeometricum salsisoli TaxID=2950536 RepID=A0ABU2GHJ7_9EURY|nr:hypothetical protein [Halogeometricum sp. S1BR25-6]MDS0300290.1 hypothetical protein [Halogeometricum sp. S1BR25-6]
MTTNHGYNTPSEGTVDWHHPLNENFWKIDLGVENRGLEENLGEYTPTKGAKFLAADTGKRYLGDGSQWVEAPVHQGRLVAPRRTSDPSDATEGQIWFRTDTDELRAFIGGTSETLTASHSDGDETGTIDLSMDTMDEVLSRWSLPINRRKLSINTSRQREGTGCLEINQPEGSYYGTAMQLRFEDQPEFGSGLDECHMRCWVMLDEDYAFENGFDGRVAGKGFPGFSGKWDSGAGSGGTRSDGTNGWSARGQLYRGDFHGGTKDQFSLAYYVYSADEYQTSIHPDKLMNKGQWYQLDRYCKMNSGKNTNDGVLKQWHDGELVIDERGFNFAWTSPYDSIEGIWNNFYYGGGWGAQPGTGNNYAYIDHMKVWDRENPP